MIEMLGVLAIIGILSAGGIMGYSTAMENYRVNKLLSDLTTFASNAFTILRAQSSKERSYFTTATACNIGIVTGSYCQSKDPFGNTIIIYLRFNYESGSYNNSLFADIVLTNMPLSACVKILSRPINNNLSSSIRRGFYNRNSQATYFPSVSNADEAYAACKIAKEANYPLVIGFVNYE